MATAFVEPNEPAEKAATNGSSPTVDKASETTTSVEEGASSEPNPNMLKLKAIGTAMLWPALGILAFLAMWAVLAPQVDTSLGTLPGPVAVAEAGVSLYGEYSAAKDAEGAFYAQQDANNQAAIAAGNPSAVRDFSYAGPPTFLDQIFTSLQTVALGFILATVFAVPIGLMAGLSTRFNAAINPLIQIMKPVSPLAWLPIVTMVISAMITSADPLLPKAFVISALVVMLCSLWPTLINTAVGTSSIDKDLLNVGKVLRLGWFDKLTKLVLPASLPYIFTGMRLSLGVGWMVLIAAEMLAQNPGLGKFVWDEFQNGSSQSLARIMFAVVVIGLIGFLLDRCMMALQTLVSKNRTV
ncbi:MAG: ABC transporter permease [Erythrobacter sp.]|uniref:ABC transporter permease n=1 Tax=Erythrobacter sp. TaxID=1042 RepID=UPI003296C903